MKKKAQEPKHSVSRFDVRKPVLLNGIRITEQRSDDDPIIIIPPKKVTDPNNCVAF